MQEFGRLVRAILPLLPQEEADKRTNGPNGKVKKGDGPDASRKRVPQEEWKALLAEGRQGRRHVPLR